MMNRILCILCTIQSIIQAIFGVNLIKKWRKGSAAKTTKLERFHYWFGAILGIMYVIFSVILLVIAVIVTTYLLR